VLRVLIPRAYSIVVAAVLMLVIAADGIPAPWLPVGS
jgi:hypothetical protein